MSYDLWFLSVFGKDSGGVKDQNWVTRNNDSVASELPVTYMHIVMAKLFVFIQQERPKKTKYEFDKNSGHDSSLK